MSDNLFTSVVKALDAAGFAHRSRGPFLEVDVPPRFRLLFQKRAQVELSFNPDAWDPTHEVELVVPGCAFLDALEDALRQLGAARSVWIGGDLAVRDDAVADWTHRFSVAGGELTGTKATFGRDSYLRYLYEVRLPGPPPRTELVPIIWSVEKRQPLPPQAAAALMNQPWYAEDELSGLIQDSVAALSQRQQQQAREAAERALRERLGPVLGASEASLAERVHREKRHLEDDREARLATTDSPTEQARIEEETQRRIQLLERQRSESYRAKLSAITHMVRLDQSPVFVYAHARTGELTDVTPTIRERRVIDAQCALCNAARQRYILAPKVKSDTHLICTDCGVACAHTSCSGVLQRSRSPHCRHCSTPRWCRSHHKECSVCKAQACPDHSQPVSCCGTTVCREHRGMALDGKTSLCSVHARPCAVDGHWYLLADGVECPVTGHWLARTNTVNAKDDERALHPDAIVVCATTGTRLARDRAARCDADNAWHTATVVKRSVRDAKDLCPAHRVVTELPAGELIDRRKATRCEETKKLCHRSDLRECSATSLKVYKALLIECPVTRKRLVRRAAVSLPDDDRMLHPAAVVTCGVSGRGVARDRAVRDGLFPGRLLHPDEATRCEMTRKWGARRSVVALECCGRKAIREPEVEAVSLHFLRSPAGTGWVCTEHFGMCTGADHTMPLEKLKKSGTTGRLLCESHSSACDCHQEPHEPQHLWRGPYETKVYCSKRAKMTCGRCGWTTPATAHDHCRWCQNAADVSRAPSQAVQTYAQRIKPLLPWFVLSPTVRVSGTPDAWLFEVDTLLHGRRMFLVMGAQLWERPWKTSNWKER